MDLFTDLLTYLLEQGFTTGLWLAWNLHIDQAGLELLEICWPLPPKCWDQRYVPTTPAYVSLTWPFVVLGIELRVFFLLV